VFIRFLFISAIVLSGFIYADGSELIDNVEGAKSDAPSVRLQEFVVKRAVDYYAKINDGRFQFPDFTSGQTIMTRSHMWEKIKEEGQIYFKLNSGNKPSVAVREFLEMGGLFDCKNAIELVKQLIILDIYGDEEFDRLNAPPTPFFLSDRIHNIESITTKNEPDSPGEIGCFINVKFYTVLHLGEFFNCENLICVGSDRFVGFGPFFNRRQFNSEEQHLDQT
jgi:hypothetical protein